MNRSQNAQLRNANSLKIRQQHSQFIIQIITRRSAVTIHVHHQQRIRKHRRPLPVREDSINGHVSRIEALRILILAVSAPTKDGTLNAVGGDSSEVLRQNTVISRHLVVLKFGARGPETRRHQRTNIHILGHSKQTKRQMSSLGSETEISQALDDDANRTASAWSWIRRKNGRHFNCNWNQLPCSLCRRTVKQYQ